MNPSHVSNPVLPSDVRSIIDDLQRHGTHHAPDTLLAGKTVLWTGVNGFLGRWVLRTIDELNHRLFQQERPMVHLIALDITQVSYDLRCTLKHPEYVSFHTHDMKFSLAQLGRKPDYVVHMAGIASPAHYVERPLETIEVAVDGSRHLLKLALEAKARYLFFSSSEVYQTAPDASTPTPETYVGAVPSMTKRSSYDVSKLLGETLAHVYAYKFGLHANVIRIFNAFGKGLGEKDHRILPRIASAALGGRKLQVFGFNAAHMPTRTYCPVENTVAGIFRVLTLGEAGEAYNIGSNTPELNVKQLVEQFNLANKTELQVEHVPPPPVYTTEPQRRCPDIRKAEVMLDYQLAVPLRDGLRNFYGWAREAYQGLPPEAR